MPKILRRFQEAADKLASSIGLNWLILIDDVGVEMIMEPAAVPSPPGPIWLERKNVGPIHPMEASV